VTGNSSGLDSCIPNLSLITFSSLGVSNFKLFFIIEINSLFLTKSSGFIKVLLSTTLSEIY